PAFSAVPLGENRILTAHPSAAFMLLDSCDLVDTPRMIAGAYQPHVTKALQQLAKPGCCYADLGAGTGFHTLTLAATSGKAAPGFAVELDPHQAGFLRDN